MAIAQKLTLTTFRTDPFHETMRVLGKDLSAALSLTFAIRLYPDAPGDPIAKLSKVTAINASGVRIVSTGMEDGVPYTDLEILLGKGDNYPNAGEAGADLTLAYDFKWIEAPVASGFYNPEQTILFGDFIVKGSVNE